MFADTGILNADASRGRPLKLIEIRRNKMRSAEASHVGAGRIVIVNYAASVEHRGCKGIGHLPARSANRTGLYELKAARISTYRCAAKAFVASAVSSL